MKARLIDVAQEAGVSPKTVSNYVNGYPFMSEATRVKVREAIAKLDYRPNRSARSLRTGKIGIIGLAVPRLSTPYFAELASMMTEAAEERGYTLLIDQTGGDVERERRSVAGVGRQALDGVIVSALRMSATDVRKAADAIPVVVLGESARPPGIPYVGVDNVVAARAATEHLLGLGRRRIAAVGPVINSRGGTWALRRKGFLQAMRAAGVAADPVYEVKIRNFDRDQGVQAMTKLLELAEPPDAVFCFSDLLAIGALSVLHRRGVRVPEDIAIMGWDDIEEASYTWPPLTSVRADPQVVARTAVDFLLRRINDERLDPAEAYVDYRLQIRASTTGA